MDMLSVYVPRPGSDLSEVVWAGSGMVGSPAEGTGQLRVDFEGNEELCTQGTPTGCGGPLSATSGPATTATATRPEPPLMWMNRK